MQKVPLNNAIVKLLQMVGGLVETMEMNPSQNS